MADTIRRGLIGAGFNFCFVGTLNSDGVVIGSGDTEPVAGAADGNTLLRVEGAQTAPIQIPDSDVVDVLGDDEHQVSFDFGESSGINGALELSTRSLWFEAYVQNTSVYTVGGLSAGVQSPTPQNLRNLVGLFMRRAVSWYPATRGNEKWEIIFAPGITINPKGVAITQRQHDAYRYFITLSKSNIFPWGETFFDSAIGANTAPLVPIESTAPYALDIFKGDGARTVFNLAKTPLTGGSSIIVVNKLQAAATISAAPDRVTFVAAPGNNQFVHVFYQVPKEQLA